jgi:hypothetical protein
MPDKSFVSAFNRIYAYFKGVAYPVIKEGSTDPFSTLYTAKPATINWEGRDDLLRKVTFATGGLADFTGPAWLDGTRSNPELVLNSRDTQNFIELKDTLADMRKNGSLSLAGGDSYYEIVVNVD